MPLLETKGAASAQGFGLTLGGAGPVYIEDVFSTWLYTGTGATQTINNGIDLAGKGGLTWIKQRTLTRNHNLFDTARGANKALFSDSISSQITGTTTLTSFNSNGFSLGNDSDIFGVNLSAQTYVSWTFREQAKFFDVVTFTGNGSVGQTIAHNLQSGYGFIAIKRTDAVSDWFVLARDSSGSYWQLKLNSTAANTGLFSADPNISTVFYPSSAIGAAAVNGATYVAYLFAHNAGGFGLTGTDNVVSCGSYAGNGSTTGPVVTLGYEPQWLLIKNITLGTQNWAIHDNMRGLSYSTGVELRPNTSDPEFVSTSRLIRPLSTGFQPGAADDAINATGSTYIYIAIRRGPMKVPTTGTSVFSPVSTSGNVTSITSGFPVDFALGKEIKNSTSYGNYAIDRLRGGAVLSETNTTGAEYTSQTFKFDSNTQFLQSGGGLFYGPSIYWLMRRAPGFFDEVCYTGTGAIASFNHNLTTAPELMIVKPRSSTGNWITYSSTLGSAKVLLLNLTSAEIADANIWNSTNPTSTVFTVGSSYSVSGQTYVAYLFATCPGVSKVGSYTGTATTQVINCGFTGGARFVLIKATSTTGNWYVWDSARGIVAGNDPYLELNTTAAEVTTTDWVDTAATGFELSNAGGNLANSNGVSYIFLAIA